MIMECPICNNSHDTNVNCVCPVCYPKIYREDKGGNEKMEEQNTAQVIEENKTQTSEESKNWLAGELEEVKENAFDGERKPALKLEENKICTMTIDFSMPFEKWIDNQNESVKKIIPVHVGEADLVWWLNVKNPIYGEIIRKGAEGQTEFKVMKTGSAKTTKYNLVTD